MVSALNQPDFTVNSPITRAAITLSGVVSIDGVFMAASFRPSMESLFPSTRVRP